MILLYLAYAFAFIFYLSSILLHVLILQKVISYRVVNGGRSKTYQEQAKQSKSSIAILIVFMIYILVTLIIPSFRVTVFNLIITMIITLFWLLGTVLQLLGTTFEKRVIVWINLLGLMAHSILVIHYFL